MDRASVERRRPERVVAADETSPRPPRRRDWAVLAAFMAAFAVLFAVYYPPLPGIEDEVGFVNQALVWSRGAISSEGAGFPTIADFLTVGGRHVAARHPGRSLVALPFLLAGGVRAAFASGALLHLAMTGIGGLLLARLGRSPLWAVLLLFHPTLAIYSRTIMADASAGTALLLASLALTSASPMAGLGAGLAVGLAALMRYHAALALPIIAAAFLFPPGRPRAWRDAGLCLLGGIIGGEFIVLYNLIVYGAPTEPFTGRRGYFSADLVLPHLGFYAAALMTVWPAMLLAPFLDRSPLRWLVRATCGVFLGTLALYYFHDRGSNWLETVILGQRLLQVVLPLWVISYAGMVDDWVAAPIRRRIGDRAWGGLAGLACAGLLVAIGVGFDRHQNHLKALLDARETVVANVPEGALILFDGAFTKLVGIPSEVPAYRLRPLTFEGRPVEEPRALFAALDEEPGPWYIAVFHKTPGVPPNATVRGVVARYEMERVPGRSPSVTLYVHRPRSLATAVAKP